ncbi:S49 family peptidase [Acetobacteraceae bacterium]|nr:S49 family peptidase [Acetobacteraceae bacterium]
MNNQKSFVRLSSFLNKPLALTTSKVECLRHDMAISGAKMFLEESFGDWYLPMTVMDNVMIIYISGILLDGQGGWSGPFATFYEDIRQCLDEAASNDRIKAICLWIDSPGGMVSGCFDLSDYIKEVDALKPVHAILSPMAASAAYALACSARSISIPETGDAGSIGVIMISTNFSKMLEENGIETLIFKSGEQKADLADSVPVTDGAKQRAQESVDKLAEIFFSRVSKNRNIEIEKVKGFEAGTFMGAEAVAMGLADMVSDPHKALSNLLEFVNGED